MSDRGKATWILALLSPIIAELLSGSSPPIEFFIPWSFIGLLGMYGAGALLIRELVVRWNKGWASVIILGVAYGIIEEGLAVKSFFDPGWMDLGDLSTYGRFWSTNWVWAVWLVIYHSTISITLPILLLQLLYPQFNRARLLTDRQLRVVIILFAIDIGVYAVLFGTVYVPPAAQYLLAALVVYLLFLAAWRAPRDLVSARHPQETWKPRWPRRILTPNFRFFVLAFLFIFTSFLVASGSFTREIHPIGTIILLLAISAGTMLLLQHKMGARNNEVHKAYFAVGLLSFLILLAFILQLGGAPEMMGMAGPGIAFLMFSIYLVRKVGRRESRAIALRPVS